ncbi:hypothetical protein PAMP_019278 [Pampus punctatissimus]
MKSELNCQLSLKSLAGCVSHDTLSTPVSTHGGHGSKVKEAVTVSFVGGPAVTEQEAFPDHNLSKSPHMQTKCAGLCSARSKTARNPSAVSPRAGGTADCRMTGSKHTAPRSCPARHNNPFLESRSSVLTSSTQLRRGSLSTQLARLRWALSLKTKLL